MRLASHEELVQEPEELVGGAAGCVRLLNEQYVCLVGDPLEGGQLAVPTPLKGVKKGTCVPRDDFELFARDGPATRTT